VLAAFHHVLAVRVVEIHGPPPALVASVTERNLLVCGNEIDLRDGYAKDPADQTCYTVQALCTPELEQTVGVNGRQSFWITQLGGRRTRVHIDRVERMNGAARPANPIHFEFHAYASGAESGEAARPAEGGSERQLSRGREEAIRFVAREGCARLAHSAALGQKSGEEASLLAIGRPSAAGSSKPVPFPHIGLLAHDS
jgi:hypothetical protein